MKCDHDPARKTLAAFMGSTRFHWVGDDGDGGVAIFGNCRACDSTIGIPVQELRASVVAHGEIRNPGDVIDEPGRDR